MMSHPHHRQITPEQIASADRMHARGRNMFRALLSDYRTHRDTCAEPGCYLKRGEEVSVAELAVEMYEGMFRCGHNDCIERNIQAVCEALAYAGVRVAEGRSTDA